MLTLDFPQLREEPKPGQVGSTPGEIILWNILDDDVAVTSNLMDLGCGHPHELRTVDDEENGAAGRECGVTSTIEMVTGAAVDVIALDELLDIPEDSRFYLELHIYEYTTRIRTQSIDLQRSRA
jgi:hypothetical protein